MVSYRRLAMRVLGHVPVPFGKKKASPPPRIAAQRIAALALACALMTGMALPALLLRMILSAAPLISTLRKAASASASGL